MRKVRKKTTKIIALMMSILFTMMLMIPASISEAAARKATTLNKLPITCQILGNNRISTYLSLSEAKKYVGKTNVNVSTTSYIDPSDVCVILAVYDSGVVKVKYPTAKGYKTAYAASNDFFVNPYFEKKSVVTKKNTTVYYKSNLKNKLGTTTTGDNVYVIGKSGSNQQILYPVSSGGYKLGFVKGNLSVKSGVSSSSYDSLVGKVPTDINNKYYTTENLSYNGGYKGQCTWWCYGRFAERTGIKLKTAPNANKWLSVNAGDSRVKVIYGASNIQANCIAVRTTGTYGHVMYIEDVKTINGVKYIYFSECNTDGNGRYDAGKDCIVQKMTYSNFIKTKKPAGYVIAR